MLDKNCKKPQKVNTAIVSRQMMRNLTLMVIILLSALIPGSLSEQDASDEVVVTVDSTNLRFSPSSVTIYEGDSVRFFWSGELLAHNAVAEDGLFDSGDASRNVDYRFTFEIGSNGTHDYICEPHEAFGMVGTIIVEPTQQAPSPEPGDEEQHGDVSSSGDWIPFFGLEIVVVVLLAGLLFHLGRAQGIGEVRLIQKPISDEEVDSET